MIKYQYVHVLLIFYYWINIIEKLPRFLTDKIPRRTLSGAFFFHVGLGEELERVVDS
jgi:hypothetical protein